MKKADNTIQIGSNTAILMGCYRQLEGVYDGLEEYFDATSKNGSEVDSKLDYIVGPAFEAFRDVISDLIKQSLASDLSETGFR